MITHQEILDKYEWPVKSTVLLLVDSLQQVEDYYNSVPWRATIRFACMEVQDTSIKVLVRPANYSKEQLYGLSLNAAFVPSGVSYQDYVFLYSRIRLSPYKLFRY